MVNNKNTISKDSKAMTDFEANKKSLDTAYKILSYSGTFGSHRFYLEKKASAFAMLGITLISLISLFYGIFQLFAVVSSMNFVTLFLYNNIWSEYQMAVNTIVFSFISMGIVIAWAIRDYFYIKEMVSEYNQKLMDKIEEENE